MPEKVTKEEKVIELAILKAKEVLAEFSDGTTVANDQDVMGEEVKLKSPKKNPAEEKIPNPTGEEGYGYVGKSVMKDFLSDERDRDKQRRIKELTRDLDDVNTKLEELEITGSDKNSAGFDASQDRKQKKLLEDEQRLTQQIGDLHDSLGKAIMLKRLLKAAQGLDLVMNIEMDSITKSKMDDIRIQFGEALERFTRSPMKAEDKRRYLKEYNELTDIVERMGLKGETEMDAEHGGRAKMQRTYGFNLHE